MTQKPAPKYMLDARPWTFVKYDPSQQRRGEEELLNFLKALFKKANTRKTKAK